MNDIFMKPIVTITDIASSGQEGDDCVVLDARDRG
jgi:hypothetical protein